MGRFWSELNPTLRGFLVIAAIALLVMVLNLYVALASLYALAGIAFFLAMAFFVYLLWRPRHPRRARRVFREPSVRARRTRVPARAGPLRLRNVASLA
jgi:hypothetical protein